ncbi:MAG: polysaccharide deacetylase family protein, partial [Muribaculaceae bacterium]|nr:polysaccharide deacetylase family protein [Muribaculaceae bacterium]
MNILSFDIEEWYIEKMFRAGEQWKYDAYTAMLERLLDLLDSRSTRATFFCLGALAEHFPDVVRRIAARGHEIGCHSMTHKWVNLQTPEEFMADTRQAIDALQD